MRQVSRIVRRLGALSLLGGLLLSFPLLGLAVGEWQGLPAPLVYLFGAWALLIVAAALIAERPED